jgi:hypothetical protein
VKTALAIVQVLPCQDRDAVEIGALYRKAKQSIIDGVRFALECGHKLKAKKDKIGHGKWIAWIEDNADALGFGIRSADRLMRGATKLDASVQFDEAKALQISRLIWGHAVRGTGGTGEFERYTPVEYIDIVRHVLGVIDLDPASCKTAQRIVQAKRYFSYEDDGLKHEWHGHIFLNPPYHRKLGPKFIAKLIAERVARRVTTAITLTNNCTDTEWFGNAAAACDAVCFTMGRVNFLCADGVTTLKPTQGQAFFYFGDDVVRFKHEFGKIGIVMKVLR